MHPMSEERTKGMHTMAEQRSLTENWENRWKFPCNRQAKDERRGLHLIYYNPEISLWLSVDPLAEERQGISPYNYVQNNPLNRVDPSGALDESIQKPNDWYRNKETGEVIWLDGHKNYEGWENKGHYYGKTDIDNNRTFYNGDTKTKSYNGVVVKDYKESTARKGYNFVMDNIVGSALGGVEELGWMAAGTGIGTYHSLKDAMNGGTGSNIRVNMKMPIYTLQNGKMMKTDLGQFSFGERVSMGFSGITTLAGGTSSLIKTGIKDWYGELIDYSADQAINYYISKGLEGLKGN